MRKTLLISLLILAFGVGVLVLRQLALRRQVQIADEQNQQLTAQTTALAQRLEAAEARIETLQDRAAQPPLPGASLSTNMPPANQERLIALEQRLRTLLSQSQVSPAARGVPEYDPTLPQPEVPDTAPETNATPMRSWGPEQVTGPPNTLAAGDIPTAWAPRSPDGGAEWLAAGFDQEVELAEVRIRESYNPGAIVRVAALVNGQEATLWEGAASSGQAPRDFVVRAPPGLRTRNVVVHLDTTRVPGWNEIDAAELVGRDGTRQWASSATASSSYAEATSLLHGLETTLSR